MSDEGVVGAPLPGQAQPAPEGNQQPDPGPDQGAAGEPQGQAEEMIPKSVLEKRISRATAANRKAAEENQALLTRIEELERKQAGRNVGELTEELLRSETPDGFGDWEPTRQMAHLAAVAASKASKGDSTMAEKMARLEADNQAMKFQMETQGLSEAQRDIFAEIREETGLSSTKDLLAIAQARHSELFSETRAGTGQHFSTQPGRGAGKPKADVPASVQLEEAIKNDPSAAPRLGPLLMKAMQVEGGGGSLPKGLVAKAIKGG